MAAKALSTLEELLGCSHPQTRARAAAEILDRAGYGREQNIHVRHTDEREHLSVDQLRRQISDQLNLLPVQDREKILARLRPADRQAVLAIHDQRTAFDVEVIEVKPTDHGSAQ